MIADDWHYDDGDGCAVFFSQLLKAANPDVSPHGRILEIGCAEFDWMTLARETWPHMTILGVDWRDTNSRGQRVNALEPGIYPLNTFDAIVSISAVEHFGLGHYDQDPLDPDGDTHIIANAMRWLKPGGWLLFDVPYDPNGYQVCGTSHRVYDDDALWSRLWVNGLAHAKATARWWTTVYAESHNTKQLIEKPTTGGSPFYYVGMAWQKCVHPAGCRCLSCG